MLTRRGLYAALLLAPLAASCSQDGGVASVLVVSTVEVSPPSGAVVLGQTLQLVATPKTEGGIPLPGHDVTWSSSDNATATVTSDGVVTGHSIGGPVRIRATVEGVTGETQITVLPLPVDHVIVTPDDNPIVVGQAAQLTAIAYTADNTPLTGRTFVWSSSASSIAAITTTGLALGISPGGPVTITANAEGKSGSTTVTVSQRPAARLGFGQQPGSAIAGIALTPAIKVLIQDDLLGTVTDATSAVTIALAGNPTGATLSGTRTVNAVNGIATFANLVVDRAGTGYTLVATSPGLFSAISMPFTVVAGAPNKLALTTAPPSTARSGVAFGTHPVVQIRDGSNNPVSQSGVVITASIASGNGTLGGTTTATTNAAGTATFSNLVLSGPAGAFTISFSASGIAPVTSGTITLTPGPPESLDIVTQPAATAQSGAALARQPSIRLLDGSGNPVAQSGVAITASIASGPAGATLGGTAVASTNASGVVTFSGLTLTGPAGSYVLGFDSGTLPQVTSAPVVLGAGAGASLGITTQPSATVMSGAALQQQPVVQLRDGAGNPVSQAGVLVSAAIQSGGGQLFGSVTAATNAAGSAAFTDLSIGGPAGPRTLLFSSAGYVSVASATVMVSAGAATQLSLTTQPSASAQSGVVFGQQPAVQLTDGSGNPVSQAGLSVVVSIASGPAGASLGGTTTVATGTTGAATFTGLSITGTPGAYTLAFAANGVSGVTSATVTLAGGSAAQLSLVVQPSTAAVNGAVFPQQPVVQVVDGSGNPVSQSGIPVTVAPSGGTLGGNATVNTDATGRAAFTGLSITGKAGIYTLNFSAPSLAGITSGPIDLTPGPLTTITITVQPSASATSGIPFAQQPAVQATDISGNSLGGVPVTVAIASGGGTLGGTVTVATDVNGVAAFSGLSISGSAGTRTLSFTAGGAPPAVSSGITLGAGAASVLTIQTQPSGSVQSGVAFPVQPAVTVTDASGNPVGGVVVTAVISSGGGTLGGTTSATSNASGVASFGNLSISGTIGTRTLDFTATGLTPATSSKIDVNPGPAAQVRITQQPSGSVQHGQHFPTQPIVQVLDAAGNGVAGVTVVATLNTFFGTGKLNGTKSIVTDSRGLATYTDLQITKAGLGYTIKFAAGPLSVTSNQINVN